jgi:hypothetical protein
MFMTLAGRDPLKIKEVEQLNINTALAASNYILDFNYVQSEAAKR